jgi:amino acid transporter
MPYRPLHTPPRKYWVSSLLQARWHLDYIFPISIAIVALLTIVTISYQQTIHAYPGGGGAYIVSRDNLGELPAQIAGSALLTDYILTVAVSISLGLRRSFPLIQNPGPYRVWIGVAAVILIMLLNLRGVKESGTAIACPLFLCRHDVPNGGDWSI